MDGLFAKAWCGPQPKTYSYLYPTLEECLELNECPEFVEHHGKIDVENKKIKNHLKEGYKLMCKGFKQTEETSSVLNFESLCAMVEGKNIDIPTTVWLRAPPGKHGLASSVGIQTYDDTKCMRSCQVKAYRQDFS